MWNEEGDLPIQSGSNDPDSESAYLLPETKQNSQRSDWLLYWNIFFFHQNRAKMND